MSSFESHNAYWEFAQTVRKDRRWVFDGMAGGFLAAVRAASHSRMYPVKAGSRLYRAQVGTKFAPWRRAGVEDDTGIEEEHPLEETRMIPDPKHVRTGGRANPPGFAYLYLADRPETALAEMRPWVGESLTLAIFEVQKNISLVVCQAGAEVVGDLLFQENPPTEKLDQHVWNEISRAFARPVNREDQESAYVPTQILAEVFKAEGFDGLAYRSGLERGTNVVLFNVDIAKPTDRFVYTLKEVRYEFEAAPNYAIYRTKDGRSEYLTELHTEPPPHDTL